MKCREEEKAIQDTLWLTREELVGINDERMKGELELGFARIDRLINNVTNRQNRK